MGSCTAQKIATSRSFSEESPAFPGALGFGKYATGGRGGKVNIVSNLNDDGEGSLRQAVKGSAAKIVVFTVSGTIHLKSPISIKANTTIAGQSAPGDGICIADHPVSISGDNVIVRFLRFRMGDRYQNEGKVAGAGHDDALTSSRRKLIIIDHCSMSWSTDEVLSIYAGDSSTVQWNIMAEPLNLSYHFEKGKTDFEEHGYGGILGGRNISVYFNLYAHCKSRTPRFDGNRNLPAPASEFADYKNNVIYNWESNNVYGGEGGRYNIVANYYKPGPSTKKSALNKIANPFKKEPSIPFGKWHINANYMHGSNEISSDNWQGVTLDKGSEKDLVQVKAFEPFPSTFVNLSAEKAYDLVLSFAGASYKRDTMDARIINDVINGEGRLVDVQGGFAAGTAYEKTVTAWPYLQQLDAPADSDKDGMPDEWEIKNKLDPSNPSDAILFTLHDRYSNVEVYLNELVEKMLESKSDSINKK